MVGLRKMEGFASSSQLFPWKSLSFVLQMTENTGENCLQFLTFWFPHACFPNSTCKDGRLYFSVLNYLKFEIPARFAPPCLLFSWFVKLSQWLTSVSGLSPCHHQLQNPQSYHCEATQFLTTKSWISSCILLVLSAMNPTIIKVTKRSAGLITTHLCPHFLLNQLRSHGLLL